MLSIVITVLLVGELLLFMVYDFIKNRARRSGHFLIRLLAGGLGIGLIILEVLSDDATQTRYLILDIMAAVELLLLYPCSFEKTGLSLLVGVLLLVAVIISVVFSLVLPSGSLSFRFERVFFSYLILLLLLSGYYAASVSRRFSGIRLFFRNAAVWHNLEDYSRFIYSLVFLGLGVYSLCSLLLPGDAGEVMEVSSLLSYMVLYAILYMRDMTGRTFVLNQDTERKIKEIIKGNLRTSFVDKAEEDKKMNNLYNRVMLFMNEKKPFLDPSFHMEDLAEEVYSNKLYLSRTINILSGRNFRQFVNYHRVQYAISLFKKDPRLKVGEAASMSGFHSTVSFNMAFKVNTGRTPSEWLQEHSYERVTR